MCSLAARQSSANLDAVNFASLGLELGEKATRANGDDGSCAVYATSEWARGTASSKMASLGDMIDLGLPKESNFVRCAAYKSGRVKGTKFRILSPKDGGVLSFPSATPAPGC